MTLRSSIVLPTALLLSCMAVTRVHAQSGQVSEDVWKGLRYSTGWVALGILTADSEKWAGGEPGFEILGEAGRGRKPVPSIEGGPPFVVLPKSGDRVRLRGPQVLWILDFKLSGEKNRLLSPTTRRRSEKTDETGITLPGGSELLVRDVQIASAARGLRIMWVRISPVQTVGARK